MPSGMISELVTFLWSAAGGAAVALLYDFFRIKHRLLKHKVIFIHIDDIIFWSLAAGILRVFVFIGNNGELRGYILLGAVCGAALYIFTIGKLLTPVIVTILRAPFIFLKKIFKK